MKDTPDEKQIRVTPNRNPMTKDDFLWSVEMTMQFYSHYYWESLGTYKTKRGATATCVRRAKKWGLEIVKETQP